MMTIKGLIYDAVLIDGQVKFLTIWKTAIFQYALYMVPASNQILTLNNSCYFVVTPLTGWAWLQHKEK